MTTLEYVAVTKESVEDGVNECVVKMEVRIDGVLDVVEVTRENAYELRNALNKMFGFTVTPDDMYERSTGKLYVVST